MTRYSMEQHLNIFNDDSGERIVVRQDRDGLDLVEIVLYDELDKEFNNITFTKDQALLVSEALKRIAEQIKED